MATYPSADEPARRVEPDELPLWLPGEALERAMFELCRDHWPTIRDYALAHGRGVAVLDRASAEKQGTWPPTVLLRHRGQEYGVGSCRSFSRHPTLQADLDRDPRAFLVFVSMQDADGVVSVGEFVFNVDRGPSGHELAEGTP
jgi:hypothetical protein